MLKFYLWNVPGLSLIIPAKTGIEYATQTGGHYCFQQCLEGMLLPLYNIYDGINQEEILNNHFVSKWGGWCGEQGIDEETADFVDAVFEETPYTSWIHVDRRDLAASHEAWIHVVPKELRDTETIEFGDFAFKSGVLTWLNSD
jgi:hypothetical protein